MAHPMVGTLIRRSSADGAGLVTQGCTSQGKNMERSGFRILFNAEPYGFGPSSAIHCIASYLIKTGRHAYAGTGHSLDLQHHLPYETVHDLTGRDRNAWTEVIKDFDVVVTAMDVQVAMHAISMGKYVVFYDALAWHWQDGPQWKSIKKIINHPNTLYLAQDFFGVSERLGAFHGCNYRIVPPIVSISDQPQQERESDFVLLNLGGLQNPYISDDELITFAGVAASTLRATLPRELRLHIATSRAIANADPSGEARAYSPPDVQVMLRNCKFAVCTPGLGNIFETAALKKPVIWLPPANITQGQQLAHLRKAGLVDADIDWSDLGLPVDYDAPYESCMRNIAQAMKTLESTEQKNLIFLAMLDAIAVIRRHVRGSAWKLIERFGANGDAAIVAEIHTWLDSKH